MLVDIRIGDAPITYGADQIDDHGTACDCN